MAVLRGTSEDAPVDDDDDRGESRRQIARRAQRAAGNQSARLAHVLMTLPASALRALGLNEELRAVVDRSRAVKPHVARRRAERNLAGELRRVDLADVEARIAKVQATGAAEPQKFRLAEEWRARLIEEGSAAAAEFPGGAAEPLPHLVAEAQRERETGRPRGAARALFRHIVAVLGARPADAGAAGDAVDDVAGDDES